MTHASVAVDSDQCSVGNPCLQKGLCTDGTNAVTCSCAAQPSGAIAHWRFDDAVNPWKDNAGSYDLVKSGAGSITYGTSAKIGPGAMTFVRGDATFLETAGAISEVSSAPHYTIACWFRTTYATIDSSWQQFVASWGGTVNFVHFGT